MSSPAAGPYQHAPALVHLAAVVAQTQPVYGYDLFNRAINGLPF